MFPRTAVSTHSDILRPGAALNSISLPGQRSIHSLASVVLLFHGETQPIITPLRISNQHH